MRLVYFGSGAFGLPTLERLAAQHDVLAVVSQPDKPAGRGSKLTPTPIAAWAAEHLPATPLLKPIKCNDAAITERIRGFPADAWVVIAFGQKLGRALLADRFAINLHASLLPRWRGAAPINAAILGGDTVTGNSVITLADRMDAGLVLGQSRRDIDPLLTAGELHDLLAADGPDLVERVLTGHATGTLEPVTQVETDVTIATKLSKDDDSIDFHSRADFLRRQVHALTPWPGITVALQASPMPRRDAEAAAMLPAALLKLLRVQPVPDLIQHHPPGTLFDPSKGLVAVGGGTTLRLLDVQPPGKRPMPWDAYARGRPPTVLAPTTTLIAARQLPADPVPATVPDKPHQP